MYKVLQLVILSDSPEGEFKMESVYIVLGTGILCICILDFLWTTLWVDGGAGPVTKKVARLTWKIIRKLSRDHPKILSLSGPVILSFTLLTWIMLLWAGWTFVFAGEADSIADSQNSQAVTWMDRIYYAGYLIFTLGNGDFSPQYGWAKIASILATGTGMLFITLGVTYILSVLEAVTQKRAFSESVESVGHSGKQFVLNAWNGRDFKDLNLFLNTLSAQLGTIIAQHKAYPILHYYYAEDKKENIPVAVVILDEALNLIRHGIQREVQPNQVVLQEIRSTIKNYIDTLTAISIVPSEETPPLMDLHVFNESKIPTAEERDYLAEMEKLEDRRKKLAGLLEVNALEWPDENG